MSSTGQTIALIKALSGGGGGGGGSEEQFSKVYETTLQNAAEMLMISSTDMGGAYIDMVVCASNSQALASDTAYQIAMSADEGGDTIIWGDEGTFPAHGDWAIVLSAISTGGLLDVGKTVETINGQTGERMFLPYLLQYPTSERPCISMVGMAMQNGIPAGTVITVYARKKVA